MRIMPLLKAACLSLMLSACVALLMMSPTSQLMWALLKPLVGFDPERGQPVRAAADQGQNDRHAGAQLREHHAAAQDRRRAATGGPLFYVVSRYAPVPDVAKQAGMVWNADTNQLAVMVQKVTGDPGLRGKPDGRHPDLAQRHAGLAVPGHPAATALTGAGQGAHGRWQFSAGAP